ncbi:hypothetical protein [Rhodococcus sp. B7740]|uniref:hypothetical protein n=1 Tax=Rhodococcus sp. B7740 TaxID=1564114 RepID=UPI00118471E9|nr:hypothetical protein [Rhodococcus sp. B7740]
MLTNCRVVTDREVVGHVRQHVFDAALDDMAAGSRRRDLRHVRIRLAYPVHRAADFLFCTADVVPVGKDVPHVDVSRVIARRFNDRYGAVLEKPHALLTSRHLLWSGSTRPGYRHCSLWSAPHDRGSDHDILSSSSADLCWSGW